MNAGKQIFMVKIIIYHLVFNFSIYISFEVQLVQKGTFSNKIFEIIKFAIILINL